MKRKVGSLEEMLGNNLMKKREEEHRGVRVAVLLVTAGLMVGWFAGIASGTSKSPSLIIVLNLEVYKNDTVTLLELSLHEGVESTPTYPGDYEIRLLDASGVSIYTSSFGIPFYVLGHPPKPVDHVSLLLGLPYSENVKKVVLLHNDKVIYSKDLEFCDFDMLCEESENYLSCPNDCPSGSKDRYCDAIEDGICDPDCGGRTDVDCTPPVVDITSPMKKNYSSMDGLILINYTVIDDDPHPTILIKLNGKLYNETYIDMGSLTPGKYLVEVEATDKDGATGSDFVFFRVTESVPTPTQPGFEAIFAIPVLLIVSYLIRRRS
jgi:hypothetical protein